MSSFFHSGPVKCMNPSLYSESDLLPFSLASGYDILPPSIKMMALTRRCAETLQAFNLMGVEASSKIYFYWLCLHFLFLAHLSTKCSWWAIVTGLCPSSVVVRRASPVVRKRFYLNIFSSETTHWILTKLHRNDPWVVPYQSCSTRSSWLHN